MGIKNLTIKRVKRKFLEHYRTIQDQNGMNSYSIKIVKGIRNVSVEGKSIVKDLESTDWAWSYRDGYFKIRMSNQHDLPLVVDDIMNLYSTFVEKKGSVRIYKARWIMQSTGVSLRSEKGFIAHKRSKHNGITLYYHAKTIEKAYKGICLKEKRAYEIKDKKNSQDSFIDTIPPDLKISCRDALDSGNCRTGIKAFAKRHNLSLRKKYNAREIYKLDPGNYGVRRTIEYAMSVGKVIGKAIDKCIYGFFGRLLR